MYALGMPKAANHAAATSAAPAAGTKGRCLMARMVIPAPAAALLRLMGKGWSFTPYPATGKQRELQLRYNGRTIVYVVPTTAPGCVIARYPQTGFKSTGAVKPSRTLAAAIKRHQSKLAAASAARSPKGKARLPVTPKGGKKK